MVPIDSSAVANEAMRTACGRSHALLLGQGDDRRRLVDRAGPQADDCHGQQGRIDDRAAPVLRTENLAPADWPRVGRVAASLPALRLLDLEDDVQREHRRASPHRNIARQPKCAPTVKFSAAARKNPV